MLKNPKDFEKYISRVSTLVNVIYLEHFWELGLVRVKSLVACAKAKSAVGGWKVAEGPVEEDWS
jgi:hypothetical protein